MMSLQKYLIVFVTCITIGLLWVPSCHAIQIISPANGVIVHQGETITITVTGESLENAWVWPSGDLPQVVATGIGEFTLSIPPNVQSGRYALTAIGKNLNDTSSISIIVERSDTPSSIELSPSALIQFNQIGDQMPIQVFGIFSDGGKVLITKSPFIKYSSANTAVATVNSEGFVTAVGPGGTTVTASYAGLSSSIPAVVPLGNATPVYKITATPTGTISKDVTGNYTINVNITNNSNVTLALLTLASATLNNKKATWLPGSFTVFDPGMSQSVGLTFPAAAGISGTTAVLQLKGTYEGLPKNGQSGDKGALNFSFRVRLP